MAVHSRCEKPLRALQDALSGACTAPPLITPTISALLLFTLFYPQLDRSS